MFNYTLIVLFTCLGLYSHPVFAAAGQKIINSKLADCPDKPNCISTENNAINPVLINTKTPEQAWILLQEVVVEQGGKLVRVEPNYLWATFQTPILSFTDDVEARLDTQQKIIHLRSASRVGYYDFGTNQVRLEQLIEIFSSKLNPERLKNSYE